MKPFIRALALTLASSIVSTAAFAAEPAAADAEALLKKHACIACHSPTTKLVGPAYKDVAAKYRDQKDAKEMLVKKVKDGGTGVWGQVPMPPNAKVPDADLQAMVKWILALK